MTNALPRLEQELAKVRERSTTLAQQLYGADVAYFKALAAAARQQLVLAAYHICTQKYPKAFLKLSLRQRQQIQQELRHLGQQLEWQILASLVAPTTELEDRLRSLLQGLGSGLGSGDGKAAGEGPGPVEAASERGTDSDAIAPPPGDGGDLQTTDHPNDHPTPEGPPTPETAPTPDPPPTEPPPTETETETAPADGPLTGPPDLSPDTLPAALMARSGNPLQILNWQRSLEKAVLATLQTFSQEANQQLRTAAILPRKIPLALLDMAGKNDLGLGTEVASSTPNLLDLILESDDDAETERPPLRLTAIHLRLAEIELADASVVARRPPLQQTVDALGALCAQYEKLRQQYAIAQAEAAWRSSWFED